MIDWGQIEIKKGKGTEKTVCPNCSPNRRNKKDPCLSVNHEKGVAKCHHCEDYSVRDFVEKKTYEKPNQEWQNHTSISDKLVKWFKGRGISQQTLIDCKVTEEKHYQPALQKEVNNIVFNYFEGNELVNKKFRSGGKQFTQVKNAKKIFYGLNDVMAEDECYIVEGEIDKLSLWEIGIKNCISVPNGAGDLSAFENCEEYIKNISKFYLAVDNDTKGRELENEILKRLGKHKCYRVNLIGKDANEDLQAGFTVLNETIQNITRYPINGTFTAENIKDKIFDLYENGAERVIKGNDLFFKGLNNIFSFLKGQLTVITGIPGHGKSNFIEWYVLNLVNDNGFKASFYSPEHLPMEQHHLIMAEKAIGKSSEKGVKNRLTKSELQKYITWSSDKIYLTMPEKAIIPDWAWLFEKFEEQIYRYGIDLFVIDAFNKVKLNTGSLFELSEILARLTLFCQMHGVNIFLIAHPTKMKKGEGTDTYLMPTLYDVKGTGDFYDQTHNGLTVYRNFGEDSYTKIVATKLKFRHQGDAGQECIFKFNPINGRYYGYNDSDDCKSIIDRINQSRMEEIIVETIDDKPPF